MPNLNLTHSGNMNITSASLGSGGTLNVQYGPNLTGAITGWTFLPELDEVVCGQTYDITFYPQMSGTVLTETFTVSGYDEAGVQRSDTGVLRQGYDGDYRNYMSTGTSPSQIPDFPYWSQHFNCVVNSFSVNQNNIQFNLTVTGSPGDNAVIMVLAKSGSRLVVWTPPIVAAPGPDTGSTLDELNIVVDDSITGTGVASATYTPSTAQVDLVYSSSDNSIAMIDPDTGAIAVRQSGRVRFCVQDRISNRSACKYVDVYATSVGEVTAIYEGAAAGVSHKVIYNVCDNVEYVIFPGGNIWTNEDCQGGEDLYYVFPESNTGRTLFIKTTDMTAPGFNVVPILTDLYLPTGYELENSYGNSVWFSGLQSISLPSDLETIPYLYFGGVPMQSINLPSSLRVIEEGAFEQSSLTGITIPEGVTTIGQSNTPYGSGYIGAFSTCSSLTYVNLPSTLQILGDGTFSNCTSLTAITIPSSVTYVGSDAFYNCSGLSSMTFESSVPPTFGAGRYPLGDPGYSFPIYVPCEAATAYRNALPDYAVRITCDEGEEEVYANNISIVVSDLVEDSATVSILPTPSDASVFPQYSSSDPDIASIDPYTGELTVHQAGTVIITARDILTNKTDSKEISVVPYIRIEVTFSGSTGKLWDSYNGYNDLKRVELVLDNGSIADVTNQYTTGGSINFRNWNTGNTNTVRYCFYESKTSILFEGMAGMTKIVFPEGFTTIGVTGRGANGDYLNKTIKSVTLPSTVTSVTAMVRLASANTIYCYATTAPTLVGLPDVYSPSEVFTDCGRDGGTLYYPAGSNYSVWLQNRAYYLGYDSGTLHRPWTGSGTL